MLNLILKIIIIASIVQTTSYATELNFEVKSSQASEDVLVDKTNEELEEFETSCNLIYDSLQYGISNEEDEIIPIQDFSDDNLYSIFRQEINKVLTKSTATRGKHLIGVYWHKRDEVFVAQVSKNKGKQEHLGCFKTELEAFNAYKVAKESFVKEQAEKWKSQIDDRAYEALMAYTVEITD